MAKTLIILTEAIHQCSNCEGDIPIGVNAYKRIGNLRGDKREITYSHYPGCERKKEEKKKEKADAK